VIAISVILLIGCFIGFVLVWKGQQSQQLVTPFMVIASFEILWTWPASIYSQVIDVSDAYPAILMALAFCTFLAGYRIAVGSVRVIRAQIRSFSDRPIERDYSEAAYLVTIVAAGTVLFFLGRYLHEGLPPITRTLIDLWRGSDHATAVGELSTARESMKGYYFDTGVYRGQGAILTMLQVGWPYLSLMAFLLFKATKRRAWLVTLGITLLMSVWFVGATGQRTPVVMVFVYLAIGVSYCKRLKATGLLRTIAGILIIAFLVTPFSGQLVGDIGDDNFISTVMDKATRRILLGDGITVIEIVRFIEDGALSYGYGRIHLEKFLTALPGVTYGIPFSMQLQALSGAESKTAFRSTTYFGVLYADFGPIGVVAFYALIGMFAGKAQNYLFQTRKYISSLPARTFVTLYSSALVLGSSVSMMASLFVVMLFFASVKTCLVISDGFRFGIAHRPMDRRTTLVSPHAFRDPGWQKTF